MTSVAAIILGAGTASRFRAADPSLPTKLVAPLKGVPLIRHVALAALASRARPVLVVTGHAAAEVEAALAGLDVEFVQNADFASGLASSLRCGLQALPPQIHGAAILLGDMPAVAPGLINRLIDVFSTSGPIDAVVPRHQGRRGNPALLGRVLFDAAATLQGDEGARRLLGQAKLVELDVMEPGVTLDVDEPTQLEALRRTAL